MRMPDGFFHNTIALADLKGGTVSVEAWPHALTESALRIVPGGIAAAAVLASLYGDALVLASGPLTGTGVPGSALLTASCTDGSGESVVVPFFLRHGPNLKASGVDFAVVAGVAAEPAILILSAGGCRMEPAGKLAGLDVYGLRKAFTARLNDTRHSLILCSPAARKGAAGAAAGQEAGTSLDRGPLAGWMARHNLVAIVLAGGGPMPAGRPGGVSFEALGHDSGLGGFLEVLDHVEGGAEAKSPASNLLGRPAACRLCPRPCMAYLRPGPKTGGTLCLDHAGFAALCANCPDALPQALDACVRLGLDPVSSAPALKGMGPDAVGPALDSLASKVSDEPLQSHGASGRTVPLWPYEEAGDRLSAGLVLGICPILLQRRADIPLEQWMAGLYEEKDPSSLREMLNASLAVAGRGPKPEPTAN